MPRAEKEEEDAREIFELLDSQLRHDLPLILELRVPYLDPSFETMVSPIAVSSSVSSRAHGVLPSGRFGCRRTLLPTGTRSSAVSSGTLRKE